MPRPRLTSTGRLRAKDKRRKLEEGQPGAAFILSKSRLKRTVKGKKVAFKGASLLEIGFKVEKELMFDGDIRKLVDRLREALASHFSVSLLAGVRPVTGEPLPRLTARTLEVSKGRTGGFGVRTGTLAHNWAMGPVKGSSVHAKTWVKPSNDPVRERAVNGWLRRSPPVDLQGVDGLAAKVITDTIDKWADDALGEFVRTPVTAGTAPRTL